MRIAYRITWGLGLGLCGLVGNLFPIEILPNAHFLLSPLFTLLSAVVLGRVGGGVTAAVASLPTVWLWGHPFGLINFVFEAVFVASLRRRFQPVTADLLFWLISPLYLFLTYHLIVGISPSITAVMAVKQAVNALLFALVVQVLLLLPSLRRRVATLLPPPLKDVPLSRAVMSLLTLCALIPLLVLGGAEGRARYNVELERVGFENFQVAASIRDEFERSTDHAVYATERLAELLAAESSAEGLPSQAEMESRLEELVRYSPGIPAAYVGSPGGKAMAFAPTHGADGKPLVGLDFSDRPYVKELRQSQGTIVSGIFQGRGGVNGLLIIVAAPIRKDGVYLGYVLTGLDIARFTAYVQSAATRGVRALVVDANANVISDSDAVGGGDTVGSIRGSAVEEALRSTPLGTAATYVARPHPLWALRGSALRHFVALPLPSVGWTVLVEQPTEQLQRRLESSYLALLLGVSLALGILIVVARALAGALLAPIQRVSEAARRLATGDRRARAEDASEHAPVELRELARHFDEMADQLGRQLEKVEAAGREKDAFLTIAAHELRTPLTSLKAQVQILERKPDQIENLPARLGMLNRQIDRLTRLINQLMDVSQLASGKLPLEPESLDVAELVRRVAELVAASSHGHRVTLDTEPVHGLYDEVRLEQLFHNLLSNAIKYSPKGGPVEVRVQRTENGGARVSIADRGIGLGAVEKVRLFERFARGTTEKLEGITGFGVGLYISREIVRLHGGTIRLEPREGGGAVATVELPLTGAGASAHPRPQAV